MISEVGFLDTEDIQVIHDKYPLVKRNKNRIMISYAKGTQRIIGKVELKTAYRDDIHELHAVWDTGASMSFISEKLARKLNLVPIDTGEVVTINGSKEAVYYIVDVSLSNEIVFRNLRVCGAQTNREDIEFIIGMDIIAKGNFSLRNESNGVVMEYEYIG